MKELNIKQKLEEKGIGNQFRKWEDWKYANFKDVFSKTYIPVGKEVELKPETIEEIENKKDSFAYNLVFVDGVFQKGYSEVPVGMSFNSSKPVVEYKLFAKKNQKNFFEEINDENTPKIDTIDIKENPSKTIYILWVIESSKIAPYYQMKINIHSKVQAEIRVGLSGCSKAVEFLNNIKMDMEIGVDSKLTYEELIFVSKGYHILQSRISQKEKSLLEVKQFSEGSPYTRSSLYISLEGRESKCNLVGTYALNGTSMTDYFIYIAHLEEETESSQSYRGIVNDEVTFSFNGEVYVDQKAVKAFSEQMTKTLCLTDKAKIYVRPQLDIHCDDVECGHGSATSGLNEGELFYLTSRGIPLKEAKRLVLRGYIQSTMKTFSPYAQNKILFYIDHFLRR